MSVYYKLNSPRCNHNPGHHNPGRKALNLGRTFFIKATSKRLGIADVLDWSLKAPDD
jgi:hypothetical protein